MNIDQYLAMVADTTQADSTKGEQPVDANKGDKQPPEVKAQESNQTDQGSAAPEETKTEEKPASSTPDKVIIDGEELTLEQIKELRLSGLRTADYTKKTQELANQRKELKQAEEVFNYLKANPQVLEQMAQVAPTAPVKGLTPEAQRVAQMEQQMADLMLQRDIEMLSARYADFDVVEVLKTADAKQITNLEDAYFLSRGAKTNATPTPPKQEEKKVDKVEDKPLDVDALRKQLKEELLKEIETERNTSTIISSQGAAPTNNETPTLTPQEDRVRQMQGLTVEEYVKYRGNKSVLK